MAESDEFHFTPDDPQPVMFSEDPPDADRLQHLPTYDNICDECGAAFKNAHGVTMHKARTHRGKNWASRPKKGQSREDTLRTRRAQYRARQKAKTEERQAKEAPKMLNVNEFETITLRWLIQVEDRILLADTETGEWWVAKKLDV